MTDRPLLGERADLRRIVESVLNIPSAGHASAEELATTILDALSDVLTPAAAALNWENGEARSPLGVAVKGLEWKEAEGGNVNSIASARTPFGNYFTEADPEGFALFFNSTGLLVHPRHSAAKAAGEADYEQRIRSALVTTQAQAGEPTDTIIAWYGANGAEWRRKDGKSAVSMNTPKEYHPAPSDAVATAARRVVEVYAGHEDGDGEPCPDIAALNAALAGTSAAPAIPDGWKLVPVEPTAEMLEVYRSNVKPRPFYRTAARVVREIIASAPSPIDKGEVK